ncbi:MAG: hypothetical protein AB1422_04020 [bacterium]
MSSLLIGVIASLISTIIGYLIAKAVQYLRELRPLQKTWQFRKDEQICVFIASPGEIDTGVYKKRITTLGHIYGFAYILNSIKKGYPNLEINHLYFTRDSKTDNFSSELLGSTGICLGGHKHNWVTKLFLEEIHPPVVFDENDNLIDLLNKKIYKPKVEDDRILEDYGIIIKTVNPNNRRNKVFIFAGCHTYGVIAAAKFFYENLPKMEIVKYNQFEVIVSGKVIGSHVYQLNKIDQHIID